VTAAAGGSSTFALPGAAMYPTVPTYPSTFDFGQFSAFGGADNATVTFSASPEFASTSYSVKYDVGGTRPENDLSDKVVVTKTMKLKPAATRAAAQTATRAGEPLPYEFVDNYTITVPAVADAPKRTYIDAWVYIHSFDGPGGTDSIRVRRYAGGDASKILYLASDGKLQAGANGVGGVANAIYFKGGSIVGLSGGRANNDPYDATDIAFNPSATFTPTSDYAAIPMYVAADSLTAKNISDLTYTNISNVRAGKGDPCMLVGYSGVKLTTKTDQEIQEILDNALYRLPTLYESLSFIGGPTLPIAGATLPFWKDYKPGDKRFVFAVSNGSVSEITYPTGATSTLKYNFWTDGAPGISKLPLEVQGAVTANFYSLVAQGYLNTDGAVTNRNLSSGYLTSTLFHVPDMIYRYHIGNSNVYPVEATSNYAFNARCVAR
jgi:hypothetical protein